MFLATENSDVAAAHADNLGATVFGTRTGKAALFIRGETKSSPVFEDPAKQVALMLYTSGTTGTPKAAMLSHQNLLSAADATAARRDMKTDDVVFLVAPMGHVIGLVTLLAVCRSSATALIEAKFAVDRAFDALQTEVTIFVGVPQMHALLFDYARQCNTSNLNAPFLRYVGSGGAPLDPDWKRTAEQFYQLPLQNGYGLTETSAGICTSTNEISDPDTSVGKPMMDTEIRLDYDALGADQKNGVGEILVRGPQIMIGYYRNPEATKASFSDEHWLRTGDLGRFDSQNRLHIVGRSKELIIRSGFNVYPSEVEATLSDHPDVVFAAVVGRPIPGNEEVIAFVQLTHGSKATEEELKAFVHTKLAPYKRPSRVFVVEELPKTPSGKIMKSALLSLIDD